MSLIEEGLAWKIGNGAQVHNGTNPWSGSQNRHILPPQLIQLLHLQGIHHLDQIAYQGTFTIWKHGWKSTIDLSTSKVFAEAWNAYINSLKTTHIDLTYSQDEIIWSSDSHEIYTLKLGYQKMAEATHMGDEKW